MPGEVQRIEFGRRNRGGIDPELRQQGFEVFPMQDIEPGEGTAARTDLLHRRRIAPPPCVGKSGRIGAGRVSRKEGRRFSRHTAAPVDDGAKDIENERMNVDEGLHGAPRSPTAGDP